MAEIAATIGAGAAVWWTVFRLPGFWRRPRLVDVSDFGFRPEKQARAAPVMAVLWTPVAVLIAVVAWVQPDDDRDGVAPWLQDLLGYWMIAAVAVPLTVAAIGRPRFAVPPSLRGELRDSPIHDVTVTRLRGADGEMYFAACKCGWDTDFRPTEEEVRSKAEQHTSRVRPELDR